MNKLVGLLILIALWASCGKIQNSSSFDNVLYGDFVDTGSTQYLTVKAAINSHCLQCHSTWRTFSEQDFITAGLVVRGSPQNSKLYYRNSLVTDAPGTHNMPTSGYPPISQSDLTTMSQWISAL